MINFRKRDKDTHSVRLWIQIIMMLRKLRINKYSILGNLPKHNKWSTLRNKTLKNSRNAVLKIFVYSKH